ncbi:hypothetical protein [Liquorilactobacillus mali]|nr:hypothetical protein [Liquorilactobacillus mali]
MGGFGYAGDTWVGHRSIGTVGKHGTATLSGTAISVDKRRASVLHPSSAF